MTRFGIVIGLFLAAPAAAQTAAPPASVTPDPARLAAADRLLRVILPPGRFQAMIDGVMQSLERTMIQAFRNNPATASMFDDDPRVRPIFERYMTRLVAESTASMRADEPAMVTAMTRAYARRFTVAQIIELETFFRTPTGQLYIEQGATIMADPDVAAWQQRMVRQQMERLPAAVEGLTTELRALPPRSTH